MSNRWSYNTSNSSSSSSNTNNNRTYGDIISNAALNTAIRTTPGIGTYANVYDIYNIGKKYWNTPVNSSSTTTTSTTAPTTSSSDFDDLYNSLYNSYSSGYSTPNIQRADYSKAIAALEEQKKNADTVAQNTYSNTADRLYKTLQRYQEQNATNVANQKQAYLSNVASLESARAEADRQNRISAAARGLGGSGLQQLAQLQNLLSQGQDISDAATKNQTKMDELATALENANEDYESDLATAELTLNNSLLQNASDLATGKAGYEAQAEQDYINALNSIAASNSSTAASNASTVAGSINTFINALLQAQTEQQNGNSTAIDKLKDTYFSGTSKNKVTNKQILNEYLNEQAANYGVDLSSIMNKYNSWFTG